MKKETKIEAEKIAQVPDRSAKAKVKFLRIGPRKVRGIIDTIRYKHPAQAFQILFGLKQKAARMTEKLLKSVVANAKVLGMDESRLYISDIRADGGPTMKRLMERSMGRANRIIKRTTHLSVILKEGRKEWPAGPEVKSAEEVRKVTRKKKTMAVSKL